MKGKGLVLIIFTLVACNSNVKQKDSKRQAENKKEEKPKIEIAQKEKTITGDPKLLLGIWILNGSENPTFKISKTSVSYIEHLTSYRYKIVADSIAIQEDDFDSQYSNRQAFKFKGKDTLILSGEDGTDTFIRVK